MIKRIPTSRLSIKNSLSRVHLEACPLPAPVNTQLSLGCQYTTLPGCTSVPSALPPLPPRTSLSMSPTSSFSSTTSDSCFGVWGLGFGVWGLGSGVWCLVFGVWCLVFGVWCLRLFQVWGPGGLGLGLRIWSLGFGVHPQPLDPHS